MQTDTLRADCRRCAALCCVAFAFDAGPAFALNKPAGQACPHLRRRGCGIHDRRAAEGFAGCVAYDCRGAGQRVTQALFEGRDWRDEPALRRPMVAAFLVVQEAHAMLELLAAARRLPLSAEQDATASALATAVEAAGASAGQVGVRVAEARRFLRSLDHLARQWMPSGERP